MLKLMETLFFKLLCTTPDIVRWFFPLSTLSDDFFTLSTLLDDFFLCQHCRMLVQSTLSTSQTLSDSQQTSVKAFWNLGKVICDNQIANIITYWDFQTIQHSVSFIWSSYTANMMLGKPILQNAGFISRFKWALSK